MMSTTIRIAVAALLITAGLGQGCAKTQTCRMPAPTSIVHEPKAQNTTQPAPVVVVHKQQAASERKITWYRQVARALTEVQALMDWHSRTRGERSMLASTYVGRKLFLSRKSLAQIGAYIAHLTGPAVAAKKRAATFLRDFMATEYIGRKTARFEDELTNIEANATVTLSWIRHPVAFRNLDVLLSQEKDAARRTAIRKAQADVIRTKLNPVLLEKYNKAHQLAQWMGYDSYFSLSEQIRQTNILDLLHKGWRFVQATDALHHQLLAQVVKESLGIPMSKFSRKDHARLMRAAETEKFLPRELMVPTFKYFLKGIGLDLRTAAGTQILIDDAMYPKKHPRAACFPISVPSDIRVSVKPSGGIMSWATLFHEGGHALHYAWTTERSFEFQQLGSASATEGFAELFARVWADPVWLRRYRKFVADRNRRPPKKADVIRMLRQKPWFLVAEQMGMILPAKFFRRRRVPLMSDKNMGSVIRHQLAWDMYLYRRYGWAKLVYESALHGANPSVWRGVYSGPISDRKKLYRRLFSKAYGYSLTKDDAQRYLFDVDPFFYAADYARAFVLADTLTEHLRKKFGPNWYENKQVGPYLKTLWRYGNRWNADEVAQRIGYKGLDYAVSERRVRRLLAVANQLSGLTAKVSTKPRRPHHRKAKCPGGRKPTPRGMCKIPGLHHHK
ncbi:MAG: hypothetical protein J7M25_10515 [Deltaproteobacteria bacterium]|nr:hypothetical protein [Deltaproteobacteria bacterium]